MQDFTIAIYPSQNKTFLASFIHPISKKRVREYFKTKEEAITYKNQTEIKFKKSRIENYQELSLEDLLVFFLQENPKSDFRKAKRYLVDFIETFGSYKLDELTTDAIKAWLDLIQQENKLKDITMRGIKCSIDTFFAYLVKKEIISESPLTTIYYKVTTPDLKTRNLLSKEDIDDLLVKSKAFSPGYLFPILKLFAETAAKPSEIIDLNWKQIDFERKEILFPNSDNIQERRLKISDELISIFERNKKSIGPVFLTFYKEPFTKNKLRRLVEEFKIKTGNKKPWTPMDLRHSFAVNFLLENGDARRLQHILGHKNVHDTRKLYGEALKVKMQKRVFSPLEIGS